MFGYCRLGLPVSPDRTTSLFRLGRFRRTIVHVVGARRQNWLEGLGQQLSGHPEQPPSEPEEQMDPSALAARIGMPPKIEAPAKNPRSDGKAPWRKALRDS